MVFLFIDGVGLRAPAADERRSGGGIVGARRAATAGRTSSADGQAGGKGRDHNCPLDFFSFHSYDRAERVLEQIESISLEMKRRGIAPELILNEWLPEPSLERVFTPEQNTDIASVLIGAQHSDLAMLTLGRCFSSKAGS